jgi:hypothetical protein
MHRVNLPDNQGVYSDNSVNPESFGGGAFASYANAATLQRFSDRRIFCKNSQALSVLQGSH